jgi:transposase
MPAKYHVGIDLHKSVAQVCVRDASGEPVRHERHRLDTPQQGIAFAQSLVRWKEGGRFVVEALGLNRWFVLACRGLGLDIVVAHSARLGLRASGKKTDKRDAMELSRRLYLGDVDRHAKTYFPTEAEYAGRKLVRARHALSNVRLQEVNQLRAILRAYNRGEPSGALDTEPGLKWLRAQRFEEEDLQASFDAHVSVLESVRHQLDGLRRRLEEKVRSEEPSKEATPRATPTATAIAQLARELPMVGAQTAATLVYELGDVTRFRGTRSVAAYAGLAPRVANSADVAHHGAITKQGSPELRWISAQWAVRLMTRNERVRAWAAPRLRRMHANKVRMTLARRLLLGVYVRLRRDEAFSLERCLARA